MSTTTTTTPEPYTLCMRLFPHDNPAQPPRTFTDATDAELAAIPSAKPNPWAFMLQLKDTEFLGTEASGPVFLDYEGCMAPDLTSARDFIEQFLAAGALWDDGLQFGRWLFTQLFGAPERRTAVGRLWNECKARRQATKRPLRVELILPLGGPHALVDLPFELLFEDDAFIFRSQNNVLVRTFTGLQCEDCTLQADATLKAVWANPTLTDGRRLPDAMFTRHEELLERHAERLGLAWGGACRRATLPTLRAFLKEPTTVLVVIAHGTPAGGQIHLHADTNPSGRSTPLAARDLASILGEAKVKVAILWICHTGQVHPLRGGVAASMLHPEQGGLVAVLASQAALNADQTVLLADRLFDSLEESLELAVAHARRALPETDPQWAAPVYYARPRQGRTVQLLAKAFDSPLFPPPTSGSPRQPAHRGDPDRIDGYPSSPDVRPATTPRVLVGASPLTEHFLGRETEVNEAVKRLSESEHRLLTLTSAPGMGKTELAKAIALRALEPTGLDLAEAVWVPLNGVHTLEVLLACLGTEFGLAGGKDVESIASSIKDQAVMVVLDNAEDLIQHQPAPLRDALATLLQRCQRLRLIITSRVLLGAAEGFPDSHHRVDRLTPADARQLFERLLGKTRAAQLSSARTTRFLDELDGHPLSLNLIAGHLTAFEPEAVLCYLGEHRDRAVVHAEHRVNGPPDGDAPSLHQKSLTASLNLSYEALRRSSAHEASETPWVFAWLGLFPAGLPRALAPHIFDGDVDLHLARLARFHLIEERGPDRRLVMAAPIRRYAVSKCEDIPAEDRERWLIATCTALGAWLADTLSQLNHGQDARLAVARLTADAETVRELIGMVLAPPKNPTDLSSAWAGVWGSWSQAMEYVDLAGVALATSSQLEPAARPWAEPTFWCVFRYWQGRLLMRQDRPGDAEKSYAKALYLYRQVEDRLGEAHTQRAMGDLLLRQNRLGAAEQSYTKALELYQQAVRDHVGRTATPLPADRPLQPPLCELLTDMGGRRGRWSGQRPQSRAGCARRCQRVLDAHHSNDG